MATTTTVTTAPLPLYPSLRPPIYSHILPGPCSVTQKPEHYALTESHTSQSPHHFPQEFHDAPEAAGSESTDGDVTEEKSPRGGTQGPDARSKRKAEATTPTNAEVSSAKRKRSTVTAAVQKVGRSGWSSGFYLGQRERGGVIHSDCYGNV